MASQTEIAAEGVYMGGKNTEQKSPKYLFQHPGFCLHFADAIRQWLACYQLCGPQK
jgi:hypothetical protein